MDLKVQKQWENGTFAQQISSETCQNARVSTQKSLFWDAQAIRR